MTTRWRGVLSAAAAFILVGIVSPAFIDAYRVPLGRLFAVPPTAQLWERFLLFGTLFAVANFVEASSEKWQYRWFLARLADGVIGLAFFYYVLSSLVGGTLGPTESRVQDGGLLDLVYLAIALSYVYLLLGFAGARRGHAASLRANNFSGSPKAGKGLLG